jgi:hypothetical protein
MQQLAASAVMVFRLSNANSGSHSPTVTASAGTPSDSFGFVCAIAVSGLSASPLDEVATNGANSTNTPASGTTLALAQPNELIIAAVDMTGSMAGGTFPPTGGPGSFTAINSSPAGNFSDCDYQIQTAGTSAVSAAWGTVTTANAFAAGIVTYKAAATSAPQPGLYSRRNVLYFV